MAVKLSTLLLSLAVIGGGLAVYVALPAPLQNPIVYVDGAGCSARPNPCVTNITAAIRLVDTNGTVFVFAFSGNYSEDVVVDKSLTLEGENETGVVVQATQIGPVVHVSADDVTVKRMTLVPRVNLVAFPPIAGVGVAVGDFQRAILEDLVVTLSSGAVLSFGSTDLTIDGLRSSASTGQGVVAVGANGITVTDSDIRGSMDSGVEIHLSQGVVIGGSGNTVADGSGRGIWVNGSVDVAIRDNQIMNNSGLGLNVSESVNVTVENNMVEDNGFSSLHPFGVGPGPAPLQGGSGGIWFWETDPVMVVGNTVRGNAGDGIGIAGSGQKGSIPARDYVLRGNTVIGNTGDGLYLQNAIDIQVEESTFQGNLRSGIFGRQSVNVQVSDVSVVNNGNIIGFASRSSPGGPSPLQGGSGGIWFWETDPSAIVDSIVTGNDGPGIVLEVTEAFDLLGNTVEGNSLEGILLLGPNSTRIEGNRIANNGGRGGAALIAATNITVQMNTFEALAVGIYIDGGCDIRIGTNEFIDVDRALEIVGTPCNLLVGSANLRFMPSTLNLASNGRWVTLQFEVSGLDPELFDLATIVFEVNGVQLRPPAGSPSHVVVAKGIVRATVKLDRAEVIAALGASGTYTVSVSGELLPGVMWSASDTVDAILP